MFAHITKGNIHDINIARGLTFPRGSIIVDLVALLRYNLFTYRDLWEWINKPFETLPIVPDIEQLTLKGV